MKNKVRITIQFINKGYLMRTINLKFDKNSELYIDTFIPNGYFSQRSSIKIGSSNQVTSVTVIKNPFKQYNQFKDDYRQTIIKKINQKHKDKSINQTKFKLTHSNKNTFKKYFQKALMLNNLDNDLDFKDDYIENNQIDDTNNNINEMPFNQNILINQNKKDIAFQNIDSAIKQLINKNVNLKAFNQAHLELTSTSSSAASSNAFKLAFSEQNKFDLANIQSTTNQEDINLENVQENSINQEDVNLEDISLNDTQENSINQEDVSLENAVLEDASSNVANLENTSLNGANLNSTNLNDTRENGINQDDTSSNDTNLDGTNLEDASSNDAQENNASLNDAKKNGVELTDTISNNTQQNNASSNDAQENGVELADTRTNGRAQADARFDVDAAMQQFAKLNDVLNEVNAENKSDNQQINNNDFNTGLKKSQNYFDNLINQNYSDNLSNTENDLINDNDLNNDSVIIKNNK